MYSIIQTTSWLHQGLGWYKGAVHGGGIPERGEPMKNETRARGADEKKDVEREALNFHTYLERRALLHAKPVGARSVDLKITCIAFFFDGF